MLDMGRRRRFLIIESVLCALLLVGSPFAVFANEPVIVPPTLNPSAQLPATVLIAEIQTGVATPTPGTRANEFIELYNNTATPLDLTGWQLRYITASATSTKNVEDPSTIITLTPPLIDGEVVRVAAGENYVLYAGMLAPPAGVVAQQYTDVLPATGGSLILVRADNQACNFVVEDAVAWGATPHLFGEGVTLPPGSSSAKDRVFQRFVTSEGSYVDTNDNGVDFSGVEATATGPATPGTFNTNILPSAPTIGSGTTSQSIPADFPNLNCTLPLLPEPNPAVPQDPPLETSTTSEPVATDPPIESPPSITESTSEPASPLPEEDDADPAESTIPTANLGLKAPMLSELLPNPAAPQTDADNEFIELYNPNNTAFDLSGYIIEAGIITTHRYIFPSGTNLSPQSFWALFSTTSGLTLSNTAGKVRLFDPLENVIAESAEYASAKDGQAWLLANGSWQWTNKPTPNAINIVSVPVVKTASTKKTSTIPAKKTTKATAKKASAPKAAKSTTAKASSENQKTDTQPIAATTTSNSSPLHPGVLAVIAASALLYGAYEYRFDLANKFARFRNNRATRATLRQGLKGR